MYRDLGSIFGWKRSDCVKLVKKFRYRCITNIIRNGVESLFGRIVKFFGGILVCVKLFDFIQNPGKTFGWGDGSASKSDKNCCRKDLEEEVNALKKLVASLLKLLLKEAKVNERNLEECRFSEAVGERHLDVVAHFIQFVPPRGQGDSCK